MAVGLGRELSKDLIASKGWSNDPALGLLILGFPLTGFWSRSQDGLSRPVPGAAERSRAGIAPVTDFPQISCAGWIGFPGSVLRAVRVDVSTDWTVKPASVVHEAFRAISGDPGTKAGNLNLHTGLVLDAPRNVCPSAILLTKRNIVSSFGANDDASLTWKRF